MKKLFLPKLILLVSSILFIPCCEKDKSTEPSSAATETNAKFLAYLEDEGDIINNILIPAVDAPEVFNHLNDYLLLDVRSNAEYLQGHIAGSKNIFTDSLFAFTKKSYPSFSKVILISSTGQAAAYCTSLLRIAGVSNIFYLNFGMASWNEFFASSWLESHDTLMGDKISYDEPAKNNYTPLPEIRLSSAAQSIKDLLNERSNALLKEGFEENFNSITSKTSMRFSTWNNMLTKPYLICIGPLVLYSSNPKTTDTYHPLGAVYYRTPPAVSDFRSVTFLQTLPSDKPIVLYSGSGQESAFYTAYLRLLGYDAKSVSFGMNNMNYDLLLHSDLISIYAFSNSVIKNYPYVTGSGGK